MTTTPPTLTNVDAILSHYAKSLKPGESIRIPLYKGKGTTSSIDPIKKLRSNNNSASSRNQPEKFPKLAKFIETVEKPDFEKLEGGRFYEEDIPKAQVSFVGFLLCISLVYIM